MIQRVKGYEPSFTIFRVRTKGGRYIDEFSSTDYGLSLAKIKAVNLSKSFANRTGEETWVESVRKNR